MRRIDYEGKMKLLNFRRSFAAISGLLLSIYLVGCSVDKEPKPVPEKYKNYRPLTSDSVTSKSFKTIKLLDDKKYNDVFLSNVTFDTSTKQYTLFVNYVEDEQRQTQVYRLNENGRLVETFSVVKEEKARNIQSSNGDKNNSDGPIFYLSHYSDAFRDNEVLFFKYTEELDMSALTVEKFAALYESASLVYYGSVFGGSERVVVESDPSSTEAHPTTIHFDYFMTYMKIEKNWIKIEAKIWSDSGKIDSPQLRRQREATASALDLFSLSYKVDYSNMLRDVLIQPERFPEKQRPDVISLNSFKGSDLSALVHKYQAKELYRDCPNSGLATTHYSCKHGWTGTDYYNVKLDDETLEFKSKARVSVFEPDPREKGYSKAIKQTKVFIQVNDGLLSENGLYLVVPVGGKGI